MSRQVTAFRLLVESQIAKRFGHATHGMKAAQIALHLKSVLAAALINPNFVLASISSGKALSLQIGKIRGNQRPVLLAVFCNDPQERDSLRRLLLALTSEVAGLVGGPVLPDASSILRALLLEWLKITALHRRDVSESSGASRDHLASTGPRKIRSAKRRRKSRPISTGRPRRRKAYDDTTKADRAVPHPDHPTFSAVPIDWRPGGRGRPPLGSYLNKDSTWHLPPGYRVIGGKIYPPLSRFLDGASVRKIRRKVAQQDQRRRTKKAVQDQTEPKEITSEAATVPQAMPEPAEKTAPDLPTEQPPQGQSSDTPAGAPPSKQESGGHPASPPVEPYSP